MDKKKHNLLWQILLALIIALALSAKHTTVNRSRAPAPKVHGGVLTPV